MGYKYMKNFIFQRFKGLVLSLIISVLEKLCVKLNYVMKFCIFSDIYICFLVQGKRNMNIFENYMFTRECNLNRGLEPPRIPRSYHVPLGRTDVDLAFLEIQEMAPVRNC